MSMVSIIIATYNSEKTLRRALDSVLNQSYQDWECIVVDGASKDNTIGIVKEYVKKTLVSVISQSPTTAFTMLLTRDGKWRKVNG